MSLKEKLEKDYTEAMKAKEAQKVSTLRLLRAAIKNAEIDKMKQFDDPEVVAVLRTEVKKLRETLQMSADAGRPELAAQAEEELKIVAGYLPELLDEAAIRAVAKEKIAALSAEGALTGKDMGRVVGEVMRVVKGKADGALVSKVVVEELKRK